jgi:transposase
VEKKTLPESLEALLRPEHTRGLRLRLMFQDEARFGRMVRLRKCWSPAPLRPVVMNGYQRQYTYVYGAVSPKDGHFDWMLSEKMNTVQMEAFLSQVSASHPDEFIVMVVDGASSHVNKALKIPWKIRLLQLPPYSPELNPCENVWDELREKLFPNRVYSTMEEVIKQLKEGVPKLAAEAGKLQSLTGRAWIIDAISIAN